jgi:hypothetical protein
MADHGGAPQSGGEVNAKIRQLTSPDMVTFLRLEPNVDSVNDQNKPGLKPDDQVKKEDSDENGTQGQPNLKPSGWRTSKQSPPDISDVTSWGLRTILGPFKQNERIIDSYGDMSEEPIDRRTHESSYQVPLPIYNLGKLGSVVEVAGTPNVVTALFDDGNLVAFRKEMKKSVKIERMPIQHRVLHVAAGICHFVANTISPPGTSNIFIWGKNSNGQLGFGSTKELHFPTEVQPLSSTSIATVCCGDHSTFALAADGQLFVWGKNTSGQLGLSGSVDETITSVQGQKLKENAPKVLFPTKINSSLSRKTEGDIGTEMESDQHSLYTKGLEQRMGASEHRAASISDQSCFYQYNRKYVEELHEDKRFHCKKWSTVYADSTAVRFNAKQLRTFQNILRQKIQLQRQLADIEKQIIKCRIRGQTSGIKNTKGNRNTVTEEGSVTSLIQDRDLRKAQELISVYELKQNNLHLAIKKAKFSMAPLLKFSNSERKKIDANKETLVELENEIEAIAQDKERIQNVSEMRIAKSLLLRKQDMLRSRKKFQESTAIKVGSAEINIQLFHAKIRKHEREIKLLSQKIQLCNKMVIAHVGKYLYQYPLEIYVQASG